MGSVSVRNGLRNEEEGEEDDGEADGEGTQPLREKHNKTGVSNPYVYSNIQ